MKSSITALSLALLACLLCAGATHAAEPIRLGVHPYLPAVEIMKRFTPLAGYLSERLGRKVEIVIAKDYEDHIEKTGRGIVDIAFLGPASYVKLAQKYGKMPLLARLEVSGKPLLQGVIFVRKDSPISTLQGLAGKRFAFGDRNSTMAHLVPRLMLLKAGVGAERLAKYSFISNHDSIALGVLMGEFDAGAIMQDVFGEFETRGLKAIALTPPISEHVFVASPRLEQKLVPEIRDALLGLKDSAKGKNSMKAIKSGMTAMVAVSDSDYNNLRAILSELEKAGIR